MIEIRLLRIFRLRLTRNSMKHLYLLIIALICVSNVGSAKIVEKSEGMKPRWLKTTPVLSNNSYQIVKTEVALAESLEGARMASVKELSKKVAHTSVIVSHEKYDMGSSQTGKNGGISSEAYKDTYQMTVGEESEKVKLIYMKIEEYWEIDITAGIRTIRLWTLYAVTKNMNAVFDRFASTQSYGAAPVAMSLIPGVGQMYKGSTLKGICMLGGVAALGIGALLCENTRSDYKNKMNEQPEFAKEYNTKANNYETARNILIGAAAAVYIYNLIDAAVAKGARRIIVKPSNRNYLSLHPIASPYSAGLSLTYNF